MMRLERRRPEPVQRKKWKRYLPLVGLVSVLAIGGMNLCGESDATKARQMIAEQQGTSRKKTKRLMRFFAPRRTRQDIDLRSLFTVPRGDDTHPIEKILPPDSLECDMHQLDKKLAGMEPYFYIDPHFWMHQTEYAMKRVGAEMCPASDRACASQLYLEISDLASNRDIAALVSMSWHLNSLNMMSVGPDPELLYNTYLDAREGARAEGNGLWIDPRCLMRNAYAVRLLHDIHLGLESAIRDIDDMEEVISSLPENQSAWFMSYCFRIFRDRDDFSVADMGDFFNMLTESQKTAFIAAMDKYGESFLDLFVDVSGLDGPKELVDAAASVVTDTLKRMRSDAEQTIQLAEALMEESGASDGIQDEESGDASDY